MRGMLKCWLLCLLVVSGTSAAQDLRYLSHQAWGTEEGLPQSSVHAIAQTPDGYLWAATEGGLARFDGVGFKVFTRKNEPAFTSDDLCCLKLDTDGSLLIGTADGTVRRVRDRFERAEHRVDDRLVGQEQGSAPDWATKAVGSGVRVQTELIDREGFGWIGMKQGLAVVDRATGKVQKIPALQADSVLSLFEDAEGNHWVGTDTSGLHILRWLPFRSEPGLAGLPITSVAQTGDGAVWVGTKDDGLRKILGGAITEPVPVAKLTSGVILCLASDGGEGNLWVGTPDGLNLISPSGKVTKITSADGLPDDYVRSIAEQGGKPSQMWVGTRKGMARILHGHVEQVLTMRDGLPGDLIGAMLNTPQGLVVETSGGLAVVEPDGKAKPMGVVANLGNAILTAMAQDPKGGVWLGTSDGRVGRLDGAKFVAVATIPENNPVLGITPDRAGNLWLRLKQGIERLDVPRMEECAAKPGCIDWGRRYRVSDGLPTEETAAGETMGGWLTRDGKEIWFPTRRGAAVVRPDHLVTDFVGPPVVLERFLVDGIEATNGAEIPFGNQRLTMEYAGLSFTAPGQVQYQVMLEGFDKDWVSVEGRRTVAYTNLAPGKYRFSVQAENPDGIFSGPTLLLRFQVIPPFWRRWWFIAAVLLAVLALVGAGIWLRVRGVRREYEAVLAERNRMAREIHDTLTQDFVGASLQLDIVAQQLRRGKVESALEQVARTRRLVSEGLDEARRSIWELRDGGSGDGLPARLRRAVVRITPAEGVAVKVQVGGAYRVLEPKVERELLRVAQEAVTNSVRHSGAAEILVDLHYSDEAVLLRIEDNGAGFKMEDAAVKAGHYGLVGMRERAAEIGAELEVASEVGVGTKVLMRVLA